MKRIVKMIIASLLCFCLVGIPNVIRADTSGTLTELPEINSLAPIKENETINGGLAPNFKSMTYRYEVKDDSDVMLDLTITSYMTNTAVKIYDNYNRKVLDETISKDQNTVSKSLKKQICLGKGVYYIWVISNGDTTGSYTITTKTEKLYNQDVIKDPIDENDTIKKAIYVPVNTPYTGALNFSETADIYKTKLTNSGIFTCQFDYYFTNCTLRILDKDGAELFKESLTWNENLSAGTYTYKTALEAGEYYFEVSRNSTASNTTSNTGKYRFDLKYEAVTVNETEPNDDLVNAEVLGIGARKQSLITLGGDVDTYKIQVPSKQVLTFYADSDMKDYQWTLYNRKYEQIKTASMTLNTTEQDEAQRNKMGLIYELSAGTYYFQIKSNSTGAYSVRVVTTKKPAKSAITKQKTTKTQSIFSSTANYSMTIWCKKVSGVDGYEFRVANNKSFKNATIYDTNQTSIQFSAEKGKTYYVQVRTYKNTDDGKKLYSAFSAKKSYTIKK